MTSEHLVSYVRTGVASGPAALLVHGIGTSGRSFAALAEHLEPTHQVVAVDLPGFGASGRPRPALDIEGQAAALAEVVSRTGLSRPVLVGHSMGSQVVTELAVRIPDLARAVILIGPVVDPEAATALRQGLRLARDVAGEPIRLNALVLRDYLRGGPRSFLETLRPMLGYPLEERLAKVTVPVVLVRGVNDPIAPRKFLDRLANRVPGAEVVDIPGARHLAMAVRPDLVARICRGFPQPV
jgi:pimeloyl-ACP methyl ester carboxylesterase